MFTKLGRDEMLMARHMHYGVSAISAQWRIQGGAKIGQGGPFLPLLQEASSSGRKTTARNRMHSNDLEACGKKCCYIWFHFEVKFDLFLDLVILPYFNSISINFYVVKCLIYIHFV